MRLNNINVMLLMLVMCIIIVCSFGIMRFIMADMFIEPSASSADIFAMYKVGFIYDMRVACMGLFILLILSYLYSLVSIKKFS